MIRVFVRAEDFNQQIGGWDTSAVTRMDHAFEHAHAFNAQIGGWDTSKVEDLRSTFNQARHGRVRCRKM